MTSYLTLYQSSSLKILTMRFRTNFQSKNFKDTVIIHQLEGRTKRIASHMQSNVAANLNYTGKFYN